jgi:REP element-mobilizing transposase RayT
VGRRLRFVPEGCLLEITCRTVQSRLLLRPSPNLNRIILGILGRAQRLYGLPIHAFVFMSNHYHLLVSPRSARQLAAFMAYLNANLAKEAGRLHRWAHHLWSHRYHLLEVSPEEKAHVRRLRYILSHGCKEGLVDTPGEWPGVQCVAAMLEGEPLIGLWFDRTLEYEARREGVVLGPLDFSTPETVHLDPLPCWAQLPSDVYRRRVADLIRQIVDDGARARRRSSLRSMGRDAILRQNPHARPRQVKRGPSPACHAASKKWRRRLRESYAIFLAAYRRASDLLRAGDVSARFPTGCFPPPLPFVSPGSG